jgi:multidrug efflux pump subunit AcrB
MSEGRPDDQLCAQIEDRSQQQLEQAITRDLAAVPDIRYWFLNDNGLRSVSLIVSGDDSATVANVAAELAAQMRRLPMLANVVSSAALNRPELRIYPRRELAVRLACRSRTCPRRSALQPSEMSGPHSKIRCRGPGVPIRVLLEENARADRRSWNSYVCRHNAAEGCR